MKAQYKIKSTGQMAAAIKIEFIVTADIIIYVICKELDYNPTFKPTKTFVEKEIRDLLYNDGCNHWTYKTDEFDSQIKFRATQKAKRLFPDFF